MIRSAAAFIVLLFTAEVRSETVDVKYRGNVDLKTFECRGAPPSSFIQRVSVGLNYSWSKGVGIWRRLSFRFRAVLTIALGPLRSGLASVQP